MSALCAGGIVRHGALCYTARRICAAPRAIMTAEDFRTDCRRKKEGKSSAPQKPVFIQSAQGIPPQGFQNHIPARGRSSKKPPYGEAYEKGAVCNDLTPKVSFPKSNLNFWGTGHIFVGLFCHKLAALAGSFVPMILGSCLETFPAVPKHKEIPLVLASPAVMLAFLAQRLDDLV